ncbi:MAG: VCBS repeat-containing protein [Ignavibacteriaceae bacterium]|nr:VCBS repeat-containing protein [Ignavibacteriaceae bacterium]
MIKKVVLIIVILFGCFSIAQNKYITREEKNQQLKNREDVKVIEVEKDLLRIEYTCGKVLYKNISDYKYPESSAQYPAYSPTFDSTIIDLTTIDTTLYYQKYSYWTEVPVHNWEFDHLVIGDVNNNRRTELYGSRKFFWSDFEPVTIYELNEYGNFNFKYQYDSVLISRNIYDVNKDGLTEVHLSIGGNLGIPMHQRFYSQESQDSLAVKLDFIFSPYTYQSQLNDLEMAELDGDAFSDLLFVRALEPDIHIYEYNPATNNFDSVFQFNVFEEPPWANAGFSISDFDLDGKTDMVFGTGKGAVYVLENEGNNQYTNSWLGMVETYHAYVHTWSHDIDGNGKPEFWVLGDAFYNGQAITRITIFETNGNNSYQVVGRIDLIGVFSFYAGTMQAVDIDNDGIDEVAVCIDENFLIFKFNGSSNHHTYELYYIKQNELAAAGENSVYFGARTYDLLNNGKINILISMDFINKQGTTGRRFTQIYKPDSTSSVSENVFIPNTNILFQNYPNPFNPATTVRFSLVEIEDVSIRIYDIVGKEIKLLLDKNLPTGEYIVQWDGKDDEGTILPGGVYFIQMTAGNYRQTIKSVLLK